MIFAFYTSCWIIKSKTNYATTLQHHSFMTGG